MHFLRLLRIFVPLLIVAAIVASVVLVLTSRSELHDARGRVETAWRPLRSALDTRYGRLATADGAVRDTPGPIHQIVVQLERASTDWHNLETGGGSVASQVTTANDLEALGRRLVIAAIATPRLAGNAPALAAIDGFAASPSPGAIATTFDAAVRSYERQRDRPARRLAARVLGYKSIPAYDTSAAK